MTEKTTHALQQAETSKVQRYHQGLIAGFISILALIAFVTFIGLSNLQALQNDSELIVSNHMAKIELVTTIYTSARQRIVTMQKMSLTSDPFLRDEQSTWLDKLAGTVRPGAHSTAGNATDC